LSTSQLLGSALGLAVLNTIVTAATEAATVAGAPAAEALTSGYRAGFRWGLVIPALMALCVLGLPREREEPSAVTEPAAPAGCDERVDCDATA
jgi:hypothetical protein